MEPQIHELNCSVTLATMSHNFIFEIADYNCKFYVSSILSLFSSTSCLQETHYQLLAFASITILKNLNPLPFVSFFLFEPRPFIVLYHINVFYVYFTSSKQLLVRGFVSLLGVKLLNICTGLVLIWLRDMHFIYFINHLGLRYFNWEFTS